MISDRHSHTGQHRHVESETNWFRKIPTNAIPALLVSTIVVVSFQDGKIAVAIVVSMLPWGKGHSQIHFCKFFLGFELQTLLLSKSQNIYVTSQHEKQFSQMVPWSTKKDCRKIEKQRSYLFSEARWVTVHWGDGQTVTGKAYYSIHKSLLSLPSSSFFLDPFVTISKY